MANPIINDLASTNQYFHYRDVADELTIRLERISALVQILSQMELETLDRPTYYHSLCMLSDSMFEVQNLVSRIGLNGS